MFGVPGKLPGAAALGFVHGRPHRGGDSVGIEDNPAGGVAGRTAESLNKCAGGTQKAFLVRIQDSHQGNFGNIQPLPQQIDAYQHVTFPHTQGADNCNAFQGVDIGMEIACGHSHVAEILRKFLGHAFGQRGDQHPLSP